MPHERYLKLKSKKKKAILDAIIKCLEKKSFQDISIMDFANEANISRGTFYTYFYDKQDAIVTFVNSFLVDIEDNFKIEVRENNNDFFKAIRKTFYYMKKVLETDNFKSAIKNLMYQAEVNTIINYAGKNIVYMDDFCEWVLENSNIGYIYAKDIREVRAILEIVFNMFSNSFVRVSLGIDKSSVDKDFLYKLGIVERGLMRKNLNDKKTYSM